MESFIQECYYCDGSGYVDSISNYEEKREFIESINDMIYGFQQKMKIHQRLIPELRRCYLNELADKYDDKVDTYARAIGRLKAYKLKKLL